MSMNIITPVFFTVDFFNMLVQEHFWSSVIVIICLMICCVCYIHKHREETGNSSMAVTVYLILLLLICILFSFVALRDEQNDYYGTQESVTGPVSYELIKKDNVIYVYERF